MSAIIYERYSDKRFRVGNSVIVRSVPLPVGWSQIRAGIVFQVDTGATIPTPNIALGFCKGTTNCYGDQSVTHFVGINSTTSWAYSGGTLQSLTIVPLKKVGSTRTEGTSITSSCYGYGDIGSSEVRSFLFCDLYYGSPNYTVRAFYRNALNTSSNPGEDDFRVQMEAVTPAYAHSLYQTGQTVAVDEGTDGTLDTFNFYWGSEFSPIEITILGVSVLA